ncbi:MAG: metal ABC transporter permease [Clostridia bacterium]|nr:metal ABC transporter permease [Clostridia bacterium]
MQRALIVGSIVSLCSALLGVILVLKNYAMIGDGLSHVGFGSLTVAVALGTVTVDSLPAVFPEGVRSALVALCGAVAAEPLIFTLIVVTVCAAILLRVNRLRGDSAIAMLSTVSLAIGVVVTSTSRGMNVDVYNYLFGSILTMGTTDVYLAVALGIIVVSLFAIFYRQIFSVTFDEAFAEATGLKTGRYNMLVAILTALTIVVGMRLMGTMLISCLIIFPTLTATRLFGRFNAVLICASVVSVVCVFVGLSLSCLCALPTGAAVVLANVSLYLVFSLIARLKR